MESKRIALMVACTLVWCAPTLTAQQDDGFRIQWHDHTILTNQPPPELAPALSMEAFPAGEPGYYFVQFTGPITRAMKAQVTETGGEILDYVPNNAFLVRMDLESRVRVKALAVVQWVGLFQPAYRLSTALVAEMREAPVYDEFPAPPGPAAAAPDAQLTVLAFRGADLARLKADVAAVGGEVLDSAEGKYDSKLAVTLPAQRLSELARLGGVKWIEPRTLNKLHNDTGRGVMNVAPVWAAPNNLRGNGQIIGVSDTGLDSGVNNATMHDDVEGRIVAINSWVVQPYGGVLNVGADDTASDLDSGHGTHVAGSVLGSGTLSGNTFAGTAPQARLVFQAVEQWTNVGSATQNDYLLTGIPLDLNNLFQQSYDAGARIQTNSWGGGTPGAYDGQSQDVDEFVWDNPDMLILYSAGNDGAEGADADNIVDQGSVTSPGTCKNCVTVGASENNRAAIPQTWAARFGALIDTDRIADATSGMAAFSSRGPAQNNRIKPDVVAPGTMVASLRTQAAPNAVRFTDDMESGVGGWATTGAWAQTTADATSGATSWHDSPGGNYAANANGRLTSPTINLSTGGNQRETLQFWARWDFPDPGDQWFLDVSSNGGATWGGIPGISGTQANWELFSIGLGPFANSANVLVRLRLSVDGDAVRGDGLYIDDVRLVEGAFGSSLLSDQGLAAAGSANDQNYLLFNGTSMATPLTAGAAALVRQYYTDVEHLGYVSAALLRATLINGATDMDPGQYGVAANNREMAAKPNNVEGWGRVNVADSLYPPGAAVLDWVDELGGLETTESRPYTLSITDASVPIVVTMVYHDFPGAAIVNQLDLTVSRGGTTFFPNGLAAADLNNNVEQIVIPAAQVATGDYTITVNAPNVPQGPQPYALVTSAGGTLGVRNPVDVMLVLDISGSMLSAACPGCDPKLDVLKDAVEIFIQLWSALAVPNDRLGVTYFRTNITEFTSGGNVLLPVLANAPAMITDVQGQSTTMFDLTAMGGGLQSAINRLTDAARPRSIVLLTDGQQNVNPMVVEIDDSPPPGAFDLEIANDPGTSSSSNVSPTTPPTKLDTALGRKVNTIAVGASASWVSLLQKIAAKTGGQHKETTAPDNDLRRFYVEELVDALRGFSPQLIAYRKGQLTAGSAAETFAVNASAEKLVLKLSWTAGDQMSFTVKKGVQDLTRAGRIISGPFYRIWSLELPAQLHGGTIVAAGDWVMEIDGQGAAAYEAAAIADETVLDYEFSAGEAVYEVGEPLRLSVSVSAEGSPVADAVVKARVFKPGASIGTLLSTTATPSFSGIQAEPSATGGQKKMQLLLQDGVFWNALQAAQLILSSS